MDGCRLPPIFLSYVVNVLLHVLQIGTTRSYVATRALHLNSDPERAKKGLVGIANYRNSAWSANYSWMTLMSNTFKFSPIEIKGVHLVHAGTFARVMAPLTNLVVGPWIRNSSFTLHAHEGQDSAVLSSLAHFGIPSNCVPGELGGEVH